MTQLSFSILEDLNLARLLFLDTSIYTSAPVSPTLDIKFPNFNKIHTTPIQYGEVNILNTERLKYTDCIADFPDGIYEIDFHVDNKKCIIQDVIFRTTKAWKLVDQILQQSDYENNKDLLDKFNKINLYLRGAESVVKVNQYQAQQLYKQAISIINCFPNTNVQLFKKQCSSCN